MINPPERWEETNSQKEEPVAAVDGIGPESIPNQQRKNLKLTSINTSPPIRMNSGQSSPTKHKKKKDKRKHIKKSSHLQSFNNSMSNTENPN